jgi:DNA-directed RNA polymerase subunit RPC12/RpoP
MNQGAYSHEHRLLVCQNCGASLSVGMEGGQINCRYCGAISVWRARTEVHDIASLRQAAVVDDYERFRKLREQEGRPLLPPPGLEHLVVAGALPQQLVPQATSDWQAALKQVAAGAPFGVHDRLYFLTLMLYSRLTAGGDELRARGIVESALETLPSPQHRYLLRAMLARSAARQGDLASAEAWLAGCDARSLDLEVDSEYRMSAATIATRKHNFQGVLSLLGQRPEDVPIAQSTTVACGLLRANALERTGQLAPAVDQLAALAASHGLDDVAAARSVNAALDLCPQAFAAVQARLQPTQGQQAGGAPLAAGVAAARQAGRGVSLLISSIFGLISLGLIIAGFCVAPDARTDDDLPLNIFLWVMGGSFLFMNVIGRIVQAKVIGSLLGSLPGGLGINAGPDATWKKGAGQIVSVSSTGWTINDQPQLALRIRVFFEALPPYEVDVKLCVPEHQVPQIKPNVSLGLLVNPASPQQVSVSQS